MTGRGEEEVVDEAGECQIVYNHMEIDCESGTGRVGAVADDCPEVLDGVQMSPHRCWGRGH